MFRYILIFLAFVAALTNGPQANAQDNLVNIRLLAERGAVSGGDVIWIGTEQIIEHHWHTYWLNPGDSGTPPAVNWSLPDGFEVEEIVWPTPQKIPYPPLLNYGYEGQVLLPQKLTLPEALPEGPIELTADIELLVCKEECIPEYGTYTLTLNGPDAQSEDNTAYFQQTLKNIPEDVDWSARFSEKDGAFTLKIDLPEAYQNLDIESVEFFPADWGMIKNAADSSATLEDDVLTITHPRGERAIDAIGAFDALVKFDTPDGESHAFNINAKLFVPMAIVDNDGETVGVELNFLTALIFALVGGLILNLMPCVFPVLSIKALSLCKTAQDHPEKARLHGLAYTAGVVLSFLTIAGVLITFQTAGAEIGWGFQLQNPWVVGALAYLLFILGLNLMGFFEFANPFANIGGSLAQKEGASGSFFTGILATLVATPCTAPFMAGALGYALVQPPIVSLIIFAALGFGLALPYLTLSFIPSLQTRMPKPGPWMDVFKQVLAFPMFAAALWLFWVLSQQTIVENLSAALLGLWLITLGIWIFKHLPTDKFYRNSLIVIGLLSFALALGFLPTSATPREDMTTVYATGEDFANPYSADALKTALASDKPVFTEMTAAWCITCKVNAAVALDVASTKKLFAHHDVQYLIGDWTNEDPEITKYLNRYGRNGVPLYVYYAAPDEKTGKRPDPVILPQILTPGIVADFIEGQS